ncbi:MAG TPA: hypothetical protein VFB81_12490, partial [Myxococcales bacterium]|nr:hypothetical protein [Myxococcales bacterium]
MSRRPVKLALATSAVAVAFFAACPEPPPPPPDSLALIATPLSIPSNGTTTTITVTARTGQNQPGTGNVSLSAGGGTFGAGRTTTVTLGANGTGTATFSCNVSSDPACSAGSVRIDGSWSGPSGTPTTNYTNVTLTGGGGGGDAGNSIGLAASRNPINTNVGDTSVLAATVMSLPDGGGFPVAGATINFSTTLGTLGPNDGGAAAGTTFSETTNASGQAFSVLHAGTTAGTATVSAAGGAAGTRTATTTVQFVDPSLGASASRNPINTHVGDSSVVTATLRSLPDGGGNPVPGVAINFSTTLGTLGPNDGGAPGGTTFSETSNASGQAFAVL